VVSLVYAQGFVDVMLGLSQDQHIRAAIPPVSLQFYNRTALFWARLLLLAQACKWMWASHDVRRLVPLYFALCISLVPASPKAYVLVCMPRCERAGPPHAHCSKPRPGAQGTTRQVGRLLSESGTHACETGAS
jgi:hypothetical protein